MKPGGSVGWPGGSAGWPALTTAVLLAVLAVGCSTDGSTSTIRFSAASSLREPAARIIERYEAANPGMRVEANYASSSRLAGQVLGGAPVDVAAFADEESMELLVAAGLVEGVPGVLATNQLVVVVRPGNPARVRSAADLVDLGVVALCDEEAPCGRYSRELLDEAGVAIEESRVTRGRNAASTLAAITEGDADAAIVYRSDALRAGDRVEVVAGAGPEGPVALYPTALLVGHGTGAGGFLEHLLSERSLELLLDAGFGPP